MTNRLLNTDIDRGLERAEVLAVMFLCWKGNNTWPFDMEIEQGHIQLDYPRFLRAVHIARDIAAAYREAGGEGVPPNFEDFYDQYMEGRWLRQ